MAAVTYTGAANGVKYQVYPGLYTSTNQLGGMPADSGVTKTFNTADLRKNKSKYGVIYTGFVNIDVDGVYGFSTLSTGGSVLLIDDQPVVNNDGKHGMNEEIGAAPLLKGYHKVTVKYFDQGTGPVSLKLFITAPGKTKAELTPDTLYN